MSKYLVIKIKDDFDVLDSMNTLDRLSTILENNSYQIISSSEIIDIINSVKHTYDNINESYPPYLIKLESLK